MMRNVNAWRRYLVLVPSFGAVVLLVTLAGGPISGDAVFFLALSAAILVGTALTWIRREGLVTPVPIVALGLLVYFPVRGIVLLTSGLTNDQGINQRVLDALTGTAPLLASLDILIVAVVFALACEVTWRLARRRRASAATQPTSEARQAALAGWGTALLVVGLIGVLVRVPEGLGFLQGDEASGGLGVQLVYLASFGFGLGIILSGRANRTLPPLAWVLLMGVGALGFYMGSKDTLFQPLLALLFAGAGVAKAVRSKAAVLMAALGVVVLVFLIFPAVTTYRREIQQGLPVAPALAGVPAELISRTVVTGTPRSGGALGYTQDALLYLTNRLSGFDSVALASRAQTDPHLLTVQTLVLSPLGLLVPSGVWSSSVAQPGHYFGQQYWGSVPTNNVSIAITIFGEVQLAFGAYAVLPTAAILGILTSLAALQFRSPSRAGRAAGFVLLVTAIGFEHDVLYLLITTERRLALLGIVVVLTALGVRRVTAAPWQGLEPTPAELAEAGASR